MSDAERKPSPQPPARLRMGGEIGAALRAVLVLGFSIVTLGLCAFWAADRWNGPREGIALLGGAALVGILALRARWLKRCGQPALLSWLERKRNWFLAAWGLGLAAVVFWPVLQDWSGIKERDPFLSVMGKIQRSSEVADRLGLPVRAGWRVSYHREESPRMDWAGWRLEFRISGPKGAGQVLARKTLNTAQRAKAPPEPEYLRLRSESVLVTIDATGESLELVKPRPVQPAAGESDAGHR